MHWTSARMVCVVARTAPVLLSYLKDSLALLTPLVKLVSVIREHALLQSVVQSLPIVQEATPALATHAPLTEIT